MFKPTEYQIKSVATGNLCEDSGWLLDFKGEEKPSLIRAIYAKKQLEVRERYNGLYCYADWLPIKRQLRCDAKPITYKSKALAEKLGLKNLYITFNGYYPEIGANMRTCSFKETEAYSICARLSEEKKDEVQLTHERVRGKKTESKFQLGEGYASLLVPLNVRDLINLGWGGIKTKKSLLVKLLCSRHILM